MTTTKRRLDQMLVDRGLAESRQRARALVMAGSVLVDGRRSGKAGHSLPEDCRIELSSRLPYVSRGGFKLEAALGHFGIAVTGKVCADIGSSTGGFTDCLLQRGAARVYAVDVGVGQLDWKLRNDPRVVVREGVNARYLKPGDLPEPVDLATADVSFISLTLILPALSALLTPSGEMVILVKPQFEVGRGQVGRGGIVRDPELHRAVCAKVEAALGGSGWRTERMDSPIAGAGGNREFLVHGRY